MMVGIPKVRSLDRQYLVSNERMSRTYSETDLAGLLRLLSIPLEFGFPTILNRDRIAGEITYISDFLNRNQSLKELVELFLADNQTIIKVYGRESNQAVSGFTQTEKNSDQHYQVQSG